MSCAPVNLSTQSQQSDKEIVNETQKKEIADKKLNEKDYMPEKEEQNNKFLNKKIENKITILFSEKNDQKIIEQFINVLEIGLYNKNLTNVIFEITYFSDKKDLEAIISKKKEEGKIYIGPINNEDTKVAKSFCDNKTIFFSFAANKNLAGECLYLINFFPKNELEKLFLSIPKESKVALLYPENEYGYLINSLIDEVVNNSDAILVNRSSYKNDLSNVRSAIKELGKYELRKYELERQKQILYSKNDQLSKKRLKKLQKFKTTSDYDFTHVLLADYGLNLLQVAPLLPYFDIDPNIVQFMGTGVIDDENFFVEPSLQGTIFPGVEKEKRLVLINQYKEIYNENLLRISTLPYDLVGLLNYIFLRKMTLNQVSELLNNSNIKFDGVDGKFYFKNNMIERDLQILEIYNGEAKKIN